MFFVPKKVEKREWDVIIVGGGPAGLSAAIYSVRYGLETLVISKDWGGQILFASEIENFPGLGKVSGTELAEKFRTHAEQSGAVLLTAEVKRIAREESGFRVFTTEGEFVGQAIILATGRRKRELNVPGEKDFLGKGVSYCAVCDAPLFQGKRVIVVGGGDSAFTDALLLAKYAEKVFIVHRRREFRAQRSLVERARSNKKIEFLIPKVVKEIRGKEIVEEVVLRDQETGEESTVKVDGVFIDVGTVPASELARTLGLTLDEKKRIVVDEWMRTNIPFVYAAGSVTSKTILDQILSAAYQGMVAASSAFRELNALQKP